jgi:hypothetical protein
LMDDYLDSHRRANGESFVRIQAGDILVKCLEDCSEAPIQRLVEALIVAGPESLSVLREISSETNKRKIQVEDDMQQVLTGWKTNLESFGIHLRGLKRARIVSQMDNVRFLAWLRSHGVVEEESLDVCIQLKKDLCDLLVTLNAHYALLDRIEKYLNDWIWGVFHQLVHQGVSATLAPDRKWVF